MASYTPDAPLLGTVFRDITPGVMVSTLKKAYWVIRKRPLHFIGLVGQYWRFFRTRLFQGMFYSPDRGIHLGTNVRLQNLSNLSAERPTASITIGDDCVIYEKAQIESYGNGEIHIGASTIIGEARIYARSMVKLGARVVTSWNVFIQDFDPHPIDPELRKIQMLQMVENFRPAYRAPKEVPPLAWDFGTSPVHIGDDVWIGANVTILKGARIGDGCVIATGSVVTAGDYPARSILGGTPAKVIKSI